MDENNENLIRVSEKIRAQHRKLAISSTDSGTYDTSSPAIAPTSASEAPTIADFEFYFLTNPLVHKALVMRANRVIGDGFDLEPADAENKILAEMAKSDCEEFLKRVNYLTFFRQAILNAYVAGNEWTELVYNQLGNLISLNHGDYKTIDFRRDFLFNKVLLGADGHPVGYWQKVENLAQLHQNITTLYGSVETLENLEAARDRLENNENYEVKDEKGNVVALVCKKPLYMLLNKNEIAHLSFNNINDNFFGTSMILPAFNAIVQYEQVMNAVAEFTNGLGYPKPVISVGEEGKPPTEHMMDQAEELIRDPVRKEGFAIPYYCRLSYLTPSGASGDITNYISSYVVPISIGLRTPKELLTGEGESNRATANQASSDYEKDIEADRRILEEYIYGIFHLFLESRANYAASKMRRNPYIPKIKWKKLIVEDEALREKMIHEKWEAGAINFNEYRELLHLPEIEDRERGERYRDELYAHPSPSPSDAFGIDELRAKAMAPGDMEYVEHAEHALQPKDKLNPALNEEFGTTGVDYKEIAQKRVARKIKSVGKEKAKEIRDILVNGMAKGKSAKGIKKAIKKVGDYENYEVDRIVRTEMKNLREAGDWENAKKEGYTHKRWINPFMDKDTTALCRALHEKYHKNGIPISEPFEVEYIDEQGQKKYFKGMIPPAHVNCRSRVVYFKEVSK